MSRRRTRSGRERTKADRRKTERRPPKRRKRQEGWSNPAERPLWKAELEKLKENARANPGVILTTIKRGFELHLRYLPGDTDEEGEAFDWSLTAHPQFKPRYAWLNRAADFLGANKEERVDPETIGLAVVSWTWSDEDAKLGEGDEHAH